MIAKSTSLAENYKNGNIEELVESGGYIKKAFKILEDNGRVHLYDSTEEKIEGANSA